jgi:hypothetical protein
MIEELIKRLRAIEGVAFVHAGQVGIEDAAICHEAADTIETQAAEIERLREALRGMVEYSRFNERWQDAHPEYVKNSIRALGETE